MSNLLLSLGVFIAFHAIPAASPVRRALIGKVGKTAYIAGYFVVSIALLTWVGVAYGAADTSMLWPQWPWTRWVPVLVMPVACIFLVGGLTQPNPLSIGPLSINVKAAKFDPARAGLVSITRHPAIWALILWGLAHIVPNGNTASVLLFGLFVVLSALGPLSLDAKARRVLGIEEWKKLAGPTSNIPFLAILAGRTALDWRGIGWRPVVGGLTLYGVLLIAHPYVIGVSPLPF